MNVDLGGLSAPAGLWKGNENGVLGALRVSKRGV